MEFAKLMRADSIKQAREEARIKEEHKKEIDKGNATKEVLLIAGGVLLLLALGFFLRWRYVKRSRDTIAKQKDESEKILKNILPEEITEELKAKGKADAKNFENVSILFTDFKGFTELSSKVEPDILLKEINYCFEAFDRIMETYKIEKIKTIGDAYMAAGGIPGSSEETVRNTILAALEIQEFVKNRYEERTKMNTFAFEMRCGIHTGPVVAGIIGVKKFHYDVWGDTVNTASRLESSGEVGKVNISVSTYEKVKSASEFTFESRGEITTKGKGGMQMYFVSRNT